MSRVPTGFLCLILGAWLVSPGCIFVPRLRFPLVLFVCTLGWIGLDRILLARDMAAFAEAAPGSVGQAEAFQNLSRTVFFQDTARGFASE